jgi:hypothetical protein
MATAPNVGSDEEGSMKRLHHFVLSLDLGSAAERSALSLIEPHTITPERGDEGDDFNRYDVRALVRFPPGTDFPEIRYYAREMARNLPMPNETHLLLGLGGVGPDVLGYFRRDPAPYEAIEGLLLENGAGNGVASPGGVVRVGKRNVVAATQVAMQTQRLVFAAGLELREEAVRELLHFKMRPPSVSTDELAWRERASDDLVLSVAGGVWWADRRSWEQPERGEGVELRDDSTRSVYGGY